MDNKKKKKTLRDEILDIQRKAIEKYGDSQTGRIKYTFEEHGLDPVIIKEAIHIEPTNFNREMKIIYNVSTLPTDTKIIIVNIFKLAFKNTTFEYNENTKVLESTHYGIADPIGEFL